jgi:hypothetical protein
MIISNNTIVVMKTMNASAISVAKLRYDTWPIVWISTSSTVCETIFTQATCEVIISLDVENPDTWHAITLLSGIICHYKLQLSSATRAMIWHLSIPSGHSCITMAANEGIVRFTVWSDWLPFIGHSGKHACYNIVLRLIVYAPISWLGTRFFVDNLDN